MRIKIIILVCINFKKRKGTKHRNNFSVTRQRKHIFFYKIKIFLKLTKSNSITSGATFQIHWFPKYFCGPKCGFFFSLGISFSAPKGHPKEWFPYCSLSASKDYCCPGSLSFPKIAPFIGH